MLASSLYAPAPAAAGEVSFTLAGCEGVRADEISRLLELEHSLSIAKLPHRTMPRIAITCGPKETTIGVQDPLTEKSVMRSIPSPGKWGPGSERVLAIAASELVVASWMELLVSKKEARDDGQEMAAAREAIRGALRARVNPRRPKRWSAEVALGGRARQLSRPFWLWRGQLRVARGIVKGWRFFVQASAESGRASRTTGSVDAMLFGGGVGAAFSAKLTRRLALDIEAAVGALYARLEGQPDDLSVVGSKASGASGEATTSVGLTWKTRRLRLGLALEAGVTFPTVAGDVEGDREVLLSGPWVGGVGRFAFVF